MKTISFYSAGTSPAVAQASSILCARGWTLAPEPHSQVSVLLLPVPSFSSENHLKDGTPLMPLLQSLPRSVTIIGGHLDSPLLSGYSTVDLLRDEEYLSANARITAHCALKLTAAQIPELFLDLPVLVVGWGRIGKHLTGLLDHLGAQITVAARRESDRGMLASLGFTAVHPNQVEENSSYALIFNTVPQLILPAQNNSIVIDLASVRGVDGSNVLWARGLPGQFAPTASGHLIAQSVLRHFQNQEEFPWK